LEAIPDVTQLAGAHHSNFYHPKQQYPDPGFNAWDTGHTQSYSQYPQYQHQQPEQNPFLQQENAEYNQYDYGMPTTVHNDSYQQQEY